MRPQRTKFTLKYKHTSNHLIPLCVDHRLQGGRSQQLLVVTTPSELLMLDQIRKLADNCTGLQVFSIRGGTCVISLAHRYRSPATHTPSHPHPRPPHRLFTLNYIDCQLDDLTATVTDDVLAKRPNTSLPGLFSSRQKAFLHTLTQSVKRRSNG